MIICRIGLMVIRSRHDDSMWDNDVVISSKRLEGM